MRYGEVLDHYLKKSGMNQAELARRAGISRKAVSALVTGSNTMPYFDTAVAIADALDVTLGEMADMMNADKTYDE